LPKARWDLGAAVVGSRIYAMGGYDGSTVADNDEYDPNANKWTAKRALPTARQHAAVVAVGGKIYVIAGYTLANSVVTHSHANEVYDPSTNSWATRASVPDLSVLSRWSGPLFNQALLEPDIGGGAMGDKIYLSISTYGAVGATLVYDTTNDSWSSLPDTILRSGKPTAAEVGGKLYFLVDQVPAQAFDYRLAELDPGISPPWITQTAIPTHRSGVAVTSSSSLLYVVGGYPSGAQNPDSAAMEAFDPKTDTWATLAPAPTARQGAAAAVIDSDLYFVGGGTGANKLEPTPSAAVEVATCGPPTVRDGGGDDGSSDAGSSTSPPASPCKLTSTVTWRTRADLPRARWQLGAAAVNGRIYAIGGNNGYPIADNAELDPGLDRWTAKKPMPTARQAAVVAAVANKVYVIAGVGYTDPNSMTYSAANEVYDPATDSWTSRAPIPIPVTAVGAFRTTGGAAIGDKIYVSVSEYGAVDATLAYDTKADSWSTLAASPLRAGQPAAAGIGAKLYFLSEPIFGEGWEDRAAAFEPALSTPWTLLGGPPVHRSAEAVASSSSVFFAVGGYLTPQAVTDSAALDAYDPASNSWATLSSARAARFGAAAVVVGDRLYFIGGGTGTDHYTPVPSKVVEEATCSN
jgi:N-acetylneuraminic acid mutarotase